MKKKQIARSVTTNVEKRGAQIVASILKCEDFRTMQHQSWQW